MKMTKPGKEKKILAENNGEEIIKTMPPKYIPDAEEIRRRANDIYNLRMEFDIEGSPEDDWYQAEDLLRNYSGQAIQ